MECILCDFEIDEVYIQCGDPYCKALLCDECLGVYITYTSKHGILPQCSADDCKGVFLLSDISKFNPNIIELYLNSCYNYIFNDKMEDVNLNIAHKKIVSEIRAKRRRFVDQSFPQAIAFVANITCHSKLNRVRKQFANSQKDKIRDMSKICMNLFCAGVLDSQYKCTLCSTQFCSKCESYLTPDHQCKATDLESIKFIRSSTKCPNCNITITRGTGCPSITCANCQTNLNHTTGEETGHGSAALAVNILHRERISMGHREVFTSEQMTLILQIEAKEPKDVSDAKLKLIIKKVILRELSEDKAKLSIAKELEKYHCEKYTRRTYFKTISQIEQHIVKNTLTTEILTSILELIVLNNLKVDDM